MKKNFTKQDFYAKLKKGGPNGDCLEWSGLKSKGYGQTYVNGKMIWTHRLVLQLEGIDTNGWFVLHSCDNPACCNPNHLRLGTQKENMDDRNKRGRQAKLKGSKNGSSKLTEDQVIEIKHRLSLGETQVSIASDYGVRNTLISKIKLGINWSHVNA